MLFSELHLDLAHRYLCFVWHPPQTQRHFMVELFSSFLYLLMKALKGQKQVVLLGKIILQKYEAYAWRNDLAKRLFPIFSWEIPSVFSFFPFYATIDNKPGPVLGKIIKYSTKWKTKKKPSVSWDHFVKHKPLFRRLNWDTISRYLFNENTIFLSFKKKVHNRII